jgi:hypothetical protein
VPAQERRRIMLTVFLYFPGSYSLVQGLPDKRTLEKTRLFFTVFKTLSQEVKEKERCSGSYCQAIGFLVIKDYSISRRPG